MISVLFVQIVLTEIIGGCAFYFLLNLAQVNTPQEQ